MLARIVLHIVHGARVQAAHRVEGRFNHSYINTHPTAKAVALSSVAGRTMTQSRGVVNYQPEVYGGLWAALHVKTEAEQILGRFVLGS